MEPTRRSSPLKPTRLETLSHPSSLPRLPRHPRKSRRNPPSLRKKENFNLTIYKTGPTNPHVIWETPSLSTSLRPCFSTSFSICFKLGLEKYDCGRVTETC